MIKSMYRRYCIASVVLGVLLISFFAVPMLVLVQPVHADWNGWQYRKSITIDHSLVSANLVDFPVLIDITDADLASDAQSDGDDIYFTDNDGVQLSHEIELYDAGHLVAWVKVPSLSSSVDTVLYMYYGNALAENQEDVAGVWDSNYMMVQHLDETSGSIYDSTVEGNDGTAVNGVVRNAAGKIDGADSFDGSDDYVTIPDSSTLAGFASAFTASCWINMDSVTGRRTILNKWDAATGGRAWYIDYDSSRTAPNTLGLFVSADGSAYSYWYAAFSPVAGNWYYVAVVWRSGLAPLFYVNGAVVAATTSTVRASVYNNAEPLYIGRSYTTGRYFDGVIDEVRLSNQTRSAGWVSTCYNNQVSPSSFYAVGPEESSGAPIVYDPDPVDGAINVPVSLPWLRFNLTDPDGDLMDFYVSTSPAIGSDYGLDQGNGLYAVLVEGLNYDTTYTWRVNATDGESWTNVTYTFTTEHEPLPPVISDPYPADGATDVPVSLDELSVDVSDPNGDLMDMYCTSDPDIGSGEGLNIPDTTFTIAVSDLDPDTLYEWNVSVFDGTFWTNRTYHFTTGSEPSLRRKTLTVDHTLVSANLVNFPVLVDLTDSDLATYAQPDGDDIYFTDSSDVQLSHEIEYYSAGHLVAWVKVPSLSSSVDTVLYMYYGDAEAENQEDPSGVWDSNFVMVQHLEESSGTLYDSTGYSNNGSPLNGLAQGVAGKVDGAADFDGTDDYISVAHSSLLTGFTQGFTASFWVRFDSVSGRQTFLNKWNAATGQRAWFVEYDSSQTNKLALFVSQDGSAYSYWRALFNPAVSTWYHVDVVWQSGQQAVFYVNGATITATTSTARASVYSNTYALYIGNSYTSGRYLNGVLDEVCLSNSARSAAWILTSYNNQMDPSAFISVGSGPQTYPVDLESAQNTSATLNLGTITFDGTPYSLPNDVSKAAGSYSAQYSAALGYVFDSWQYTSGITVSSTTTNPTTVTVASPGGTLRAIYKATATPTYPVHLESAQNTSATLNLGTITFDGTPYSLPNDVSKAAGSYSAQYSAALGYVFDSWQYTSGITVSSTTTNPTTVTVASPGGTLRAIYKSTGVSGTPPGVTQTTPSNNQSNVGIGTTIEIRFNQTMDTPSAENSFSISPSVAGTPTFNWRSSNTRMTVTLNSSLAYSTVYTVTISTEAMDIEDEHMLEPYVFNFTTQDPTPPYVIPPTIPASGETNVTYTIWAVNFSEPMDDDLTEAAFSINATGTMNFNWVNSSYMNFYFVPLTSFRGYNVTISTAARDAQGENMTAKYSWIFRTGNLTLPITAKWTSPSLTGSTGECSVLIGDLTSDAGEEIIYVGVDYVRCLRGTTGAILWSYNDGSIGWNVQPQMGDIDNDGALEIVVPLAIPTGVIVLNGDGTLYWKRTGIGGSSYTSKPLIVDPDGDGYCIIFVAPEDVRGYSNTSTYTSRVWAFNYDGREINNGLWNSAGGTRTARTRTGGSSAWNAALGSETYQWFAWRPCSGGFAMADTDNDDLFELYQSDRHMYYGDGCFGKGAICWEWNAMSQSLELKWYQPDMLISSHTPILVDVNKDGVLDVLVAHMRGGLAVFNSTTGAELKKDYDIGLPSHYQPVVYDIDRDGNLEILLADGDHPGNSPPDIVVFDLYKWVTGVPPAQCIDARMYVGPCKFPPTVGEVTGDGIMDIIAVSDTGVFVFDGSHDPSVDHTYPITVVATGLVGSGAQCLYAVVQDIDADLKNEIVVGSSGQRVFAFDTPAPRTTPRPRSEVQYYNERRTGVAEYVAPVFYDRATPILSDPYPSNEATNVPVNVNRLNFTITDIQGDKMNYTVTANFPVDSADLTSPSNRSSGTYFVDVTGTLSNHAKYTWTVKVTDGIHWNNKSYTFTTPDGTPPGSAPTHTDPVLNSTGTGEYVDATSVNLICINQTTADLNGDKVTNIYRWLRNGQSIANLIMPFDTDSLTTAKDYSGYNNNGQIHGATWTSNGKVGGAYSFDGVDDYMLIPDGGAGYYNGRIYSSNLGGQGTWSEMTVEMWINLAALSTKESTRILMKIPSYEIGLGSIGGSTRPNNRLTAAVWLDNPDSGDNAGPPDSAPKATEYWSVSTPSSQPLSINTWYHVAFTYKDGKGTSDSILALYINGIQVTNSTSRTTRGPIKATSGEPLFIGWYDYFNGMIDEVRIYSRCLSKEQISLRYNETKDGLTNSSTLSQTETRTSETWTCQVTPNDSHQDGTARTSNSLLILPGPQVPPVVSNVQVWGQTSLSTSRVWSNETIIAVYNYFDENDDPEVFGGPFGTQIRWYRNGTYQPARDNLTSLSTSITNAHEDWYFQIKPGDGHAVAAEWVNSTNKVTVNSPPVVTNYNPKPGSMQTNIFMSVGQTQTFSFTYSEMDGDPVTIEWTLDGTAVAGNVTSYTWTATDTGSFSLRATLTDEGYGQASTQQRWSITVR